MNFNSVIRPIACAIAISCALNATVEAQKDSMPAYQISPSPEVPVSVTFAGKKIDCDRIDMYERLDRELTSFVYGHTNTLITIKRANRYYPVIMPILKRNGVPDDVFYLSAIESYFNIRAYSPAKAAGLWQFIPSTAKQYGLEVNDEIDERYNVEKSTEAACRYLKNGYAKYGDWATVMA